MTLRLQPPLDCNFAVELFEPLQALPLHEVPFEVGAGENANDIDVVAEGGSVTVGVLKVTTTPVEDGLKGHGLVPVVATA